MMFTSSASAHEVVRGFDLGADDYVTKPCNLAELKQRVHKVLQQSAQHTRRDWSITSDDGNLRIDFRTGIVLLGGTNPDLSPTESRLLMYLANRQGQIVPYHELLINVWGAEYAREVQYLDVYIDHLRHKLGSDPAHSPYICTHPQIGYSFCGIADKSPRT